ncbi:hypothetical protein F4815DRAFT_465192 [Daldinia loculata]|nr:hypothetical protein F4815DRAFT_465192 [Daldinia loculata]
MNAAVDTARKFDNWSEEIPTSWTPTMFTSPFGESITAHDSQLWASPGNNLDDYYRPNHQSAREELVHDIDTSDNFDSGYTIDNAAVAAGTFLYDQYTGTNVSGQSTHHDLDDPFAEHTRRSENTQPNAGDGGIFDDSTIPATIISPSTNRNRFSSNSSETNKLSPQSVLGISPASASSMNWMADGGDPPSPPSPACSINAGIDHMPPIKNRRNRERNRVAAHKCRQKAKQSMSELQTRERELSQQNRILLEHAGSLRDEILDLKNEILKHSNCDSDIIQNYISRAAREVH